MNFTYHPPTRVECPVCEALQERKEIPLIDSQMGRASSSNGYPFHGWYNFVLGFTPSFPEYMLQRENITSTDVVLDPFNGSGTTQLVCKLKGIPSFGIDANDYMVFAAKQKLNWGVDLMGLDLRLKDVRERYDELIQEFDWADDVLIKQMADEDRPNALDRRYVSDKPLLKLKLLRKAISEMVSDDELYNLFMFAVSAILVPVSNVRYGPGFGVGKAKDDVDVWDFFSKKMNLITYDLSNVTTDQINTPTTTILGDSRHLSDYVSAESVDLMITSPPYPGDHEYTKHSKLEIIFQGYATDIKTFRVIKKRMIRGSTTNIYKEDEEKKVVEDIRSIHRITDEIDVRLKNDGATSGFEKLYTKLIWEYFGGMFNTLSECFKVLKPGGKIALLVSDSHAFKMVHIKTAEILEEVGEKIGYVNGEILLWQDKFSTSHKYLLRENVLILQKPN